MSSITDIVRALQQKATPEEKCLWQRLKNKQFIGLKFKRQHPIIYGNNGVGKSLFFVADFYCAEKSLVVELDGKIHEFQKDYDENRDQILNNMGLRVVRIKNEELHNMEQVLEKIKRAVDCQS